MPVKSDLHFDILRRFRAAGIEIPYPQREIRIRENDHAGGGKPGEAAAGKA